MIDEDPTLETEVALALGPRYVWALHTEPVRIVMEMLRRTRHELVLKHSYNMTLTGQNSKEEF